MIDEQREADLVRLEPDSTTSAAVALCPVSSSSGTAVPSQRDGGTSLHGAS